MRTLVAFVVLIALPAAAQEPPPPPESPPPAPEEPGPVAPPTPAAAQPPQEELPPESKPPERAMPFVPPAAPVAPEPPRRVRAAPERPGAHVRTFRAVEPSSRALEGFSLHGGATLKRWGWGLEATLGFPYLELRVQFGLLDWINLAAHFSSIYGLMNRYAVEGKFRLFSSEDGDFAMSLAVQASASDYRTLGQGQIDMWHLSGQRDFSVYPAVVASVRSSRGNHFWISAGPDITIDWEPPSSGPLTQVPPLFDVGFNIPLAVGTEVALTRHSNFYAMLGVSLHLRRPDAPVMPIFALGIQFVL